MKRGWDGRKKSIHKNKALGQKRTVSSRERQERKGNKAISLMSCSQSVCPLPPLPNLIVLACLTSTRNLPSQVSKKSPYSYPCSHPLIALVFRIEPSPIMGSFPIAKFLIKIDFDDFGYYAALFFFLDTSSL